MFDWMFENIEIFKVKPRWSKSSRLLQRVAFLVKFQKQPFADVFQNRCSKRFCNIHRKTPVLELFFNIVAGLEDWNCIKKRLQHRCFFCEYCKIFKNTYFEEHLRTAAFVLLIMK